MNRSNAYKQLIVLLTVFVIGIFTIVGVNFFFSNLIEKLENKTVNYKAKIAIGDFIAYDIEQLKGLFYELAITSSNQRTIEIIDSKTEKVIQNLEKSLDVLEHGGTLHRVVRLNIVDLKSITKEIVYTKETKEQISLAVLDIRPKIDEFLRLKEKLIELIVQREQLSHSQELEQFFAKIREIRIFNKSIPAFFVRFAENNSRILYDSQKKLEKIEQQIEKKKQEYIFIEFLLIGGILGIVLVFGYIIARNISNTNKALEDQKHFTRGVLDAQSNIVLVTSGEKIIDANRALFEFLDGYDTLEEFKKEHGCVCDFFIDFEEDQRYILKQQYGEDNWAEYVYHNPYQEHLAAMKKDDQIHHFKLSIDRQSFVNDEHILVIVLNDITTQVMVQKDLKELNDTLEEKVKEKTYQLQDLNDNLEQKIIIEVEKNRKKDQQLLEQSKLAALGEMIGNIAHQWRQPLSIISTCASGLSMKHQYGVLKDEEIEKDMELIVNSTQHLSQTIDIFRDFIKDSNSKEKISVDIKESLEMVLEIVKASLSNNYIEVFFHSEENIKTTMAKGEFTQVITNLLNNAKDALKERKIKKPIIVVEAKRIQKNILVTVQDNGGGIDEEIMESIFEPYFTTKHKSMGTGLGLYICRKIVVESLGGEIKVENKEGKYGYGACFMITFPIVS